ncbi:hypothetical protein [Streptomyces sp. NPDC055692]|uniref:hypothetical protein n=1 Tax=Streptomyces sp. NPDC055692 TaxID=3155683 RepID=UPI00344478C3
MAGNTARLRSAVFDLATFNDIWPELTAAAPSEELLSWVKDWTGPTSSPGCADCGPCSPSASRTTPRHPIHCPLSAPATRSSRSWTS